MFTMGVAFVIFTTLLLLGGTAYTFLWFRQAGARLQEARTKPRAQKKGWRRL